MDRRSICNCALAGTELPVAALLVVAQIKGAAHVVEYFQVSKVNEALERLAFGQSR